MTESRAKQCLSSLPLRYKPLLFLLLSDPPKNKKFLLWVLISTWWFNLECCRTVLRTLEQQGGTDMTFSLWGQLGPLSVRTDWAKQRFFFPLQVVSFSRPAEVHHNQARLSSMSDPLELGSSPQHFDIRLCFMLVFGIRIACLSGFAWLFIEN